MLAFLWTSVAFCRFLDLSPWSSFLCLLYLVIFQLRLCQLGTFAERPTSRYVESLLPDLWINTDHCLRRNNQNYTYVLDLKIVSMKF